LFPQIEAAECGAACLGVVLAHWGCWVPIEELRVACGVNRDGTSAADIVRAGKRFGLNITGWSKQIDELGDIALPSIVFWDFNHFVVLEGFGRDRFYLNDPANGRRTVSAETFSRSFTGIVLQAATNPDFKPGGTPPNVLRKLRPWLRDTRGALAYAMAVGFLLALPALAMPLLLSVFVDNILDAGDPAWGGLLVAAAIIAGALVYLLVWLQSRMLRRIAVRLSVVHAERMLWHLFRLPSRYFALRYAGDLTSRVRLVYNVAVGSSRQLVAIMIELVMSVLLLALMLFLDPLLATVVAGIGIGNVVAMRLLGGMRTDENRQLRREQALLFDTGAAGLRSIDSLRATATEEDFFMRWTGYQARELTARQRLVEMAYVISSLPRLSLLLGGMAVLGIGGWQVMEGQMTIGALMAFYVLAGSFLVPIGRFVQFADALQILGADLQRIADVLDAREDPVLQVEASHGPGRVATLNGHLRLAGRVELCNVTFGYQVHGRPLVDNFNLTIEPGQRVALVGATGSGKSTLLRLVSGEFTPWSGEILFDGVPAGRIPRNVFTGSVATVDQQIFLFAASVRDNLTMWNPVVPERQVVDAARDALIHDEIMSRPSGYDAQVEEGGSNFSGGQRQRLEIARALVNNPAILLLDEATSTLDAVTEMRIDNALRRRGCTCLIVAHRLSTIRDCDRIIVLERGLPVQQGTHEELMAAEQGVYHGLVQAN
jgi:ATP-binding cassette subfamily C protein